MSCAGKVVVVTGGGRGIGAGIVRAFAKSGAQVVICDKEESGARALEQELPGAVFILCDVTQEEEVKTLISETICRFGRLDCVVNNAGYHPPPQRPEETSAQDFRQLLELNLLGVYTVTKLALPHLRKSRGNVINISSLVGAIGQSQAVPYVATKGAVTAMTKALALDESPYGVRVNCISPGNIWTPLWEELAASTPDPRATIREGTLAQGDRHPRSFRLLALPVSYRGLLIFARARRQSLRKCIFENRCMHVLARHERGWHRAWVGTGYQIPSPFSACALQQGPAPCGSPTTGEA
ncbi:17-beta-hydroxysteroid dehydrogenase 14 [Carlito syrichta]|uniref:17-beta-hydroxysteroid dehydrogenase 14 n=1 Tax=Carlito syrichta TaxID=1868482 RepID=A0A1U7SYR7_CARSF|nr:17-beta-hydroxysteroid dehydrogenase 14 [Carlito syrichta]